MSRIYNGNTRGLGVGLSAFYNQILLTNLNIQKKYSDAFLRSKGKTQISKTPVRSVVRPITAKVPNKIWQMDLIDMRTPNRKRYILTVYDVFPIIASPDSQETKTEIQYEENYYTYETTR